MTTKHLDAKGKGEYTYNYKHDILLFKIKNREYTKSIDFENLIIDIDKEGFITGLRIFDASQIFNLSKIALKNIKQFEFNATVEDKIVSIQLRFAACLRNKPYKIQHGENFVREALTSTIEDSRVECTVA